MQSPITIFILLLISTGSLASEDSPKPLDRNEFDRDEVFNEVVGHVAKHFYDQNFDHDRWERTVQKFRPVALAKKTRDAFSNCVNDMVATLNASHTFYYSINNPKRYQLLGIFHSLYDEQRSHLFVYPGIGIDTRSEGDKTWISAVYDGLPADKSGLQYGDQIVSVNGDSFHPTLSFLGHVDEMVCIVVVREGRSLSFDIPVKKLDGRTMFETALKSSVRIIDHNGQRVGYLHAWSYAGQKYQDTIREELLWGKLSKCDSVILDIRDGWGGADLNYLNLFRDPIATIRAESRTGEVRSFAGVWDRPVALLTNSRSTSGKELLTYGFKKLKLGVVVGEQTAGAVLAGRIFLLSNGDVLYLAVTNTTVDGQRLEGSGVAPDVKVERPFDFVGEDPQLSRALEIISK